MGRASGGLDTSHWIRNDISDFQGATSVMLIFSSIVYLKLLT